MSPTASPAPAERFARIIDGLYQAVAARGAKGWLPLPLLLLLWSRLRRLSVRFARLAAQVQAGTLRAPRRRPATPRPPRPPPRRLPRGFAWLMRPVPEAASAASQLQYLLAEPEMTALIAAAPQAGRLLRPLCRMLGVRPPPSLVLPRPAPPAAASPRPAMSGPAPRPASTPDAPRPQPPAITRRVPRPRFRARCPPVPA